MLCFFNISAVLQVSGGALRTNVYLIILQEMGY